MIKYSFDFLKFGAILYIETKKRKEIKMNEKEMKQFAIDLHKKLDGDITSVMQYLEDMAMYKNDRKYFEIERIYEEIIENGEITA